MIYYSSHNSKNILTDEEEIYSSQKDGRTIKVNKDLSLNDIINIILEHLIFKEDLDYFGFEKNNLNKEIISLKVDMKEFMKQKFITAEQIESIPRNKIKFLWSITNNCWYNSSSNFEEVEN